MPHSTPRVLRSLALEAALAIEWAQGRVAAIGPHLDQVSLENTKFVVWRFSSRPAFAIVDTTETIIGPCIASPEKIVRRSFRWPGCAAASAGLVFHFLGSGVSLLFG